MRGQAKRSLAGAAGDTGTRDSVGCGDDHYGLGDASNGLEFRGVDIQSRSAGKTVADIREMRYGEHEP